MMKPTNFLRDLWSDDRGQSTTEYILILSVIVLVALKFKTAFSTKLMSTLGNITGQMDQITSNNE